MNPQTTETRDLELAATERARCAERSGQNDATDTATAAARFLHRAILAAPLPSLPPGFAVRVAARITAEADDFAEHAELEAQIQRVVLVAAVLLALVLAAPGLLQGLQAIAASMVIPAEHRLPLSATALALTIAALIDTAFNRQRGASAGLG